jgi:hypothetical protein
MPGSYYDDLLRGADGRLGVDWGKDASVKSEEGYLHPTAGEPFVDMKLTLKAQPKESVVSIAQTPINFSLEHGSEQN